MCSLTSGCYCSVAVTIALEVFQLLNPMIKRKLFFSSAIPYTPVQNRAAASPSHSLI